MAYLDSHGLETLWAKIKSWADGRFVKSNNIGKYIRKYDHSHSYSSPILTIGTSDTAWHKMAFNTGTSEGDLISSGCFSTNSDSSVFTCQVPGVYSVETGATMCGNTASTIGWIYIKSGTYAATKQTNAQYWYPAKSGSHAAIVPSVSTIVTLVKGDTIEINVARGDGGELRITGNYIGITLLKED